MCSYQYAICKPQIKLTLDNNKRMNYSAQPTHADNLNAQPPRQLIGNCDSRILALITSGSCEDPQTEVRSVNGQEQLNPHHYYIPPRSETLLIYTAGSHPHICGAPLNGNDIM
ncbi:hypothetical protein AVEN_50316-1 [Araneus ventricosus]|uniref:Uncharacterized protein n=1 Tax=Araneus ventricosus TaxID=182803 RepID=A0A4Y2IAI0_ARAVE|nr:hypothetical protein AVEN_50316-1 [Araneus ventricosus]